MKCCRIISLGMGIFFLAAAVIISPAEAKTKKYKPMKFTELYSDQDSMKFPGAVGTSNTSPGEVVFTAPVRLPAGTVITGLDMWCSLAPGGEALLRLVYYDPGEVAPIPHTVYAAETTAPTASQFTPAEINGVLIPLADRVIQKGKLYFLWAELEPDSYLWRADLSYKR